VSQPLPSEIAAARVEFGLDRPLPERYVTWLGNAVRGDFGRSFASGRPVMDEFGRRLPATALLAGVALVFALVLAFASAVLAAAFRGRWPDSVLRLVLLLFAAVPSFVVGLTLLNLLVVDRGIGRALADGTIGHSWMPALCLALGVAPLWSRLLRASMLEALSANYTLVVRARGATRTRLLVKHALPNACIPFLNVVAIGVASLLGGAPIVEAVFTWPGVGAYVISGINARDLPVVQCFAVIATATYVATSALADIAAALVDPRLRAERPSRA
jgi:ABC-type dipeptide/oligopeptide/nickel transport system permease component